MNPLQCVRPRAERDALTVRFPIGFGNGGTVKIGSWLLTQARRLP